MYPENIGSHLSIDETSLSRGELYTILTNKSAKGGKGSIVAIVAGTKAETVIDIIRKIPEALRKKVSEITLDMAGSMTMIAKRCFPRAVRVTDRFHVQRLAVEALQEIRIKHRWEALDRENDAIAKAKASQIEYQPEILSNGIRSNNSWPEADMCFTKSPTLGPKVSEKELNWYSSASPILKKLTSWPKS